MRSTFLASLVALSLASGCGKAPDTNAASASPADVKVAAPADGDWSKVVSQTPGGAYVMGDPAAPVKLIEIGAMACPFCKKFDQEGAPTLVKDYVRTGKVSWEFRPYLIHGPVDLAANLIARCNGKATFFPMVRALYEDQEQWVGRIQAAPPARMQSLQTLPPNKALIELATIAGLQDWAAPRGLAHAKADMCLSDQQMINAEVQRSNDVTSQFPDFAGTPTFAVNGKLLPKTVSGWATLKPYLDGKAN